MGRGQARDIFSSTFGDRRGVPPSSPPVEATAEARDVEFFRKMSDEDILIGARDPSEEPYAVVMKIFDTRDNLDNLRRHMILCAEEAHRRRLIDQNELDRLRW